MNITAILGTILIILMVSLIERMSTLLKEIKSINAREAKLDLACEEWDKYMYYREIYGDDNSMTMRTRENSISTYEEYAEMRRKDGI